MTFRTRRFQSPAIFGKAAGGGGTFTPTSTQSSNFLTRVGAVTGGNNTNHFGLSTNECTAVDAMITGLITDLGGNTSLSTWPIIDAMYILATASRGVAALNLVSSSYTLVEHTVGAGQFTADVGYTGVAAGYIDTQFDPTAVAGQNWSRDSASFFGYTKTNFVSGTDYQSMGANGSGTFACRIYPHYTNDGPFCCVNSSTQTGLPSLPGHFIGAVRTGASLQNTYVDAGAPVATNNPDTTPAGPTLVLLADNTSGSAPFLGVASAYVIGGALNSTQVGQVNTRLSAYMAAVP